MILTTMPALQAPQSTGHPASLPSVTQPAQAAIRVQAPAKGQGASGAQINNGQSEASPGKPPTKDGEKDTAPPTILQIKINTMLQEQAEQMKASQAEGTPEEVPAKSATDQLADSAPAHPADPKTHASEDAAHAQGDEPTRAEDEPPTDSETPPTPPEDAPEALS